MPDLSAFNSIPLRLRQLFRLAHKAEGRSAIRVGGFGFISDTEVLFFRKEDPDSTDLEF